MYQTRSLSRDGVWVFVEAVRRCMNRRQPAIRVGELRELRMTPGRDDATLCK